MPADWLQLDPATVAGIAVMASVTVGLKIPGLYTQRLMPHGARLTRFLNALPGTVILSLAVPMALSSGAAGVAALIAAIAVMLKSGNILLATGIGYAIGLSLRHFAGF